MRAAPASVSRGTPLPRLDSLGQPVVAHLMHLVPMLLPFSPSLLARLGDFGVFQPRNGRAEAELRGPGRGVETEFRQK